MSLTTHQVHLVAGTACVSPATVRRYIDRRPMRVTTARAIEDAMRKALKVDPETVRVPSEGAAAAKVA